jgi:XrtN system VIT domain protein
MEQSINPTENQVPNPPKLFLGQDYQTIAGICLLMLSGGLFASHKFTDLSSNNELMNGVFILNFIIAIGYTILLLTNGLLHFFWKKNKINSRKHILILWSLWIVSCFALNRNVGVFNESADWLSVAVCISLITNCLYAWEEQIKSKFLCSALYFFLTGSFILWLYFSFYLAQLYPVSIIAMLFLGVSFHSYIPLLLTITLGRVLYKNWSAHKWAIGASVASVLLFTLSFIYLYYAKTNQIKWIETTTLVSSTKEKVPMWVKISQKMGDDWVSERVLKSDLIYQKFIGDGWGNFLPQFGLQDLLRHDPLVLLGSAFSPKLNLSQEERIKILETRFDARHYTEERLWSGANLRVNDVITQTHIYPQYRLSYTEKTLTIQNSGENNRWNTEEGLFTFFVPEGTAVTSLSLWINGKEQKGILTTQSKADSAYKTIVGIENRDPSVVHWQEGNRLVVRVFPCTPQENRRFKVGFTSPLKFEANTKKLTYENIYFKGPATENTDENVFIDFDKSPKNVESSRDWTVFEGTKIQHQGMYKGDWKITFDAPEFAATSFAFQGKNYQISPTKKVTESVIWKDIYLDIDKSWSESDVERIMNLAQNKHVWVWNDQWILLDKNNVKSQTEELQKLEFGLLPLAEIKDMNTALFITKSESNSPLLKDLAETDLMVSFKKSTTQTPLRTFVFEGLSPYLKTLKELRIIRCEYGDFQKLEGFLRDNKFTQNLENQSLVYVQNAHVSIGETPPTKAFDTPDHILRLFAYNRVMSNIGHTYFDKKSLEDSLLNTAVLGNVVTPISSLIVLETQKDYERFDIKKNKNGLDNATHKKSGAVPEPHEWALILLVCCFLIYHFRKKVVRHF